MEGHAEAGGADLPYSGVAKAARAGRESCGDHAPGSAGQAAHDPSTHMKFTKAPCSCMVHTWALKGLPYHNFGVYVYTIKLHGAFGIMPRIFTGIGTLSDCRAAG